MSIVRLLLNIQICKHCLLSISNNIAIATLKEIINIILSYFLVVVVAVEVVADSVLINSGKMVENFSSEVKP